MNRPIVIFTLLLLASCQPKKEIESQIILDKETSQRQISIATEGKHIHALDLTIKGNITGSGQLSIGDNDSTFYKTYDVPEGKIEIKYGGDWYAQFCYVTFKPTTAVRGQIEIQGDFKGD